MRREVRAKNMTKLFNKELLLYSLFDLQLQKPIRVIWILYFIILCTLWAAPILFIFPLGPYTIIAAFSVPFVGSTFMSQPIWGGKNFIDYFKTQIKFIFSPKFYYDRKAGKKMKTYYIDSYFLLSRRKDYQKLLTIIEKGERNE